MRIQEVNNERDKRSITEGILKALPEWFGIPEATAEYIKESTCLPFFAAFDQSQAVGFMAIKETSPFTLEIYVMGILPAYHRRGIGTALFEVILDWAKEQGYEFLQVKTLDASHPDVHYAITRQFYESLGFKPLECLPELWGKHNPCLIMIQSIPE